MQNSEIDYNHMDRSRTVNHSALLFLLYVPAPVPARQVCHSNAFTNNRLTYQQGNLEPQHPAQVYNSCCHPPYRIRAQRCRNIVRHRTVCGAAGICVAEPPNRRRAIQGHASVELWYVWAACR